ncbi:hypothetical protein [Streptomyces sp. NPDC088115]|uniref:hypothetical protein n=1 Tax=Streptomyces sp. NPDC088115 TaxID=3365824 RepID=UPI00382A7136
MPGFGQLAREYGPTDLDGSRPDCRSFLTGSGNADEPVDRADPLTAGFPVVPGRITDPVVRDLG